MSLDKLITWTVGFIIAFTAIGKIDDLQRWVLRAQAQLIYESRTASWGSPRFFQNSGTGSAEKAQITSGRK